MKRVVVSVSFLVLAVITLRLYYASSHSGVTTESPTSFLVAPTDNSVTVQTNMEQDAPEVTPPTVVLPIAHFYDRVIKKPFGILIRQKTSPVQPERFNGYHTGADAETTVEEQHQDVPVQAIADGRVVFAGFVRGYGGVVMIEHRVHNEVITALYGHLRQSSFAVQDGDQVTVGQHLADLGTGYSTETDGERRHLHLGIIKGAHQNTTGYVDRTAQLQSWENPVTWLKDHGAT